MVALTRPVIDPNAFVSAVIAPSGTTGVIVELVGDGLVVPVLSAELLAELDGVLRRPRFRRHLDLEQCEAFVAELERLGEVVEQPTDTPTVSRDPDDDPSSHSPAPRASTCSSRATPTSPTSTSTTSPRSPLGSTSTHSPPMARPVAPPSLRPTGW